MMQTYQGSCHCGSAGFLYATAVAPADWSVRACQCRFCRMHDALSVSDPAGTLAFAATGPGRLGRYRFGLETADFLVCKRCGVYLGAVLESPEGRFGIINAHALAPVPADLGKAEPADYSAENAAGRVRRREQRWTPVTHAPG